MKDDTRENKVGERKIGLLKNVNILHSVPRGWLIDFPTS